MLLSCAEPSPTSPDARPASAISGATLPQSGATAINAPLTSDIAAPTTMHSSQLGREFRGAWVATVANIDWPSRNDLSVAEQQAEALAIIARAKSLKLNALIFQVRPATDAMYASNLEPWSEFLTGTQGKPPAPFYDPLLFWIDAAHAQGIALHAWFNPYRARHALAKSRLATNHISKRIPDAVKTYGDQMWLDPGDARAAAHSRAVVLDVVRRYPIDGVHIDDYFYPYPVDHPTATPKREQDFPDEVSWQNYRRSGGKLQRNDWRRDNVNRFVATLYAEIKREKPHVLFGVSPFGLVKPALRPEGISGFSQYDKLYADVELWLANGWMDYLAPQLYWKIDQSAQAFEPLLRSWQAANPRNIPIWPGLYTSKVGTSGEGGPWYAEEILNQIAITRRHLTSPGHIHFSIKPLMENRGRISDGLRANAYLNEAALPAAQK